MRVSSNTSYEAGLTAIHRQQSGQMRTFEQISTGRSVLTPSANPAGYVRALDVAEADSANSQYALNRQNGIASLGMLEGTLGGITALLQRAQELAVAAVNGALNDAGRETIATELRTSLGELLGLSNRKDVNGQYLFSGYQGSIQPFEDTGSGVQYVGDEGLRMIQASSSRQLAVNESGREVFERIPATGGGYQSLFKTLSDLADLLETPVTDPASKAALASGLNEAQTNLSNALDNVLKARASVGTRMKEIDALNERGEDLNILYKQQLSELRDVDYAKAISDLAQQRIYLEATQKAFLKVQSLSLFDYIR
jgi:flagellar hook-associated protein 3 FlgL